MNRDDAGGHPIQALSSLIDGELSGAERETIDRHLAACSACRAMLADLRRLDAAIGAEAIPPVPSGLAGRIVAALEEGAVARAAVKVETRPVAAVARAAADERPAAAWSGAHAAGARRPWWFRAPMPLAAAAGLAVATILWIASPGGRPPAEVSRAILAQKSETPADQAPLPGEPSPAPPLVGTRPPKATPEAPRAQQIAPQTPPVASQTRPEVPPPSPPPAPMAGESTVWQRLDADAGAAPGSGQPSAAIAGAPPDAREAEAGALEKQESAPVAALTAAAGTAAVRPEAPTLRAGNYAVQLLPTRTMHLESGEYRCDVPLTVADARRLAALYGATPPDAFVAAADRTAPDRATSDRTAPDRAAESAEPARAPAVVQATPEGSALILTLVRERYRPAIEARCGPLPR